MDDTTRPPAVAGMFYPASQQQLAREIGHLLSLARPGIERFSGFGGQIRACIVPHAGYMYSGSIAASAFAVIAAFPRGLNRVAIFGPAHRLPVRGLALSSWSGFATPLGTAGVDGEGVRALLSLPFSDTNDPAHAREHSIEVQLPFLQTVLPGIPIVPVLVGRIAAEDVATAMELLWKQEGTLILVSTDLSHYMPAEKAAVLDASTARKIEDLDASIDEAQACGATIINGLLLAARNQGMHSRTIDLRNSADTAGDPASVVGYGAFGFCVGGCRDAERDR